MKKAEIKNVVDALKKANVSSFGDKELKNILVKNFLTLSKKLREYQSEIEDTTALFLSKYDKEQQEVSRLEIEMNGAKDGKDKLFFAEKLKSEHGEYLKAVKECNDKIRAFGEELVEIIPVDEDKFIEEYQNIDGFDLGVVGALVPLFKNK